MTKTPTRTLRVQPALWNRAKERAQSEGRTLTSVLIEFLERYTS